MAFGTIPFGADSGNNVCVIPRSGSFAGYGKCTAWPDLLIRKIESYSDLDSCNGVLIRLDPGGPYGAWFFMAGDVYYAAVRDGFFSGGLKVAGADLRWAEAPVWQNAGGSAPYITTTSPSGKVKSVGAMAWVTPGAVRTFPHPSMHIWGIITNGDGCGAAHEANLRFGAVHAGGATTPDNAPFTSHFNQFGGPPVNASCSYGVLGKHVGVFTRMALAAGRAAYLDTFSNDRARTEAAAAFDIELQAVSVDRVDSLAFGFVSTGGGSFLLPTRGFERRLSTGSFSPDGTPFIPRPEDVDVDTFNASVAGKFAVFRDTQRGTGVLGASPVRGYPVLAGCAGHTNDNAPQPQAEGIRAPQLYSLYSKLRFVGQLDGPAVLELPLTVLAGLFPALEGAIDATGPVAEILAFSATRFSGDSDVSADVEPSALKSSVLNGSDFSDSTLATPNGAFGTLLPYIDAFATRVTTRAKRAMAAVL